MAAELPMLSRKLVEEKYLGTPLANYPKELLDYPEKVIQFGEGNFLRAFVEWMFHTTNKAGLFKGKVVVVQPIEFGRVKNLNDQDGMYTLLLRGTQDGKVVDQREIMPVISRGINAMEQWEEVLKCAENPDIEFFVSNTTEAGISYRAGETLNDKPQVSFPGKVTAYLYRRYNTFKGDPSKGLVFIPCELIDRNGDNLKRIVLQLIKEWNLPTEFAAWVENHNYFLNTLVDRIVTGYPFKEVAKLEEEFGYTDQNLNTGEIFHLWVIEGDKSLSERLPFHKAGLNVKWVEDLAPYRNSKVRILNGGHTSTVAVACLANFDFVRDAVNDSKIGSFMREILFDEVIPSLDADANELTTFANAVLERFNNPFIDHKWFDIALNSTSKFEARVMPSLREYTDKKGQLPKHLVFSMAALIALYRGSEIRENKLVGNRAGKEYLLQDDLEVLQFFVDNWNKYDAGSLSVKALVENVLKRFHADFVAAHPELINDVATDLEVILNSGIEAGIQKCS